MRQSSYRIRRKWNDPQGTDESGLRLKCVFNWNARILWSLIQVNVTETEGEPRDASLLLIHWFRIAVTLPDITVAIYEINAQQNKNYVLDRPIWPILWILRNLYIYSARLDMDQHRPSLKVRVRQVILADPAVEISVMFTGWGSLTLQLNSQPVATEEWRSADPALIYGNPNGQLITCQKAQTSPDGLIIESMSHSEWSSMNTARETKNIFSDKIKKPLTHILMI